MRPAGTAPELEAVRRHALILADQGLSPRTIAHAIGRTPRSVRRWLNAAAADPAALCARPIPGRPARLTRDQLEELGRILLHDCPQAWGAPDPRWRYADLTRVIRVCFGVVYSEKSIAGLLWGPLGDIEPWIPRRRHPFCCFDRCRQQLRQAA